MKLMIEIDDDVLRSAVQAQIGQAVAKLATEELEKQAAEIINKKFERIDIHAAVTAHIDATLNKSIRELVKDHLHDRYGSPYAKIREIVGEEARGMLARAATQK